MLIALAIILALVWFVGFAAYHVASLGFHLLLVVAIGAVVLHLVQRARRQRLT